MTKSLIVLFLAWDHNPGRVDKDTRLTQHQALVTTQDHFQPGNRAGNTDCTGLHLNSECVSTPVCADTSQLRNIKGMENMFV